MQNQQQQHESTELRRHGDGLYEAKISRFVMTPASQAWAKMSDLDNLDSVIPLCEKSEAEAIDENRYKLSIQVGLPWPIPKIHYVVTSTLDQQIRQISWTVISGNLKRNDGTLRFDEQDEYSCFVHYSCIVGTGFYVPRFAEKLVEALVIPRVSAGLIKNLGQAGSTSD